MLNRIRSILKYRGESFARRLRQAYIDVLNRYPTEEEHAVQKRLMREKRLSFDELEALLSESDEKKEIIVPLENAIRAAVRLYLLRDPSPDELLFYSDQFRHLMKKDENAKRVIRNCRLPHLLNIRPINMEMDVTNTCNLRCRMCYFSLPEVHRRKRADMSLDTFKRVASQVFPGVNRLSLSFAVEPLIHPRLTEIVAIAKEFEIPKVYFATNGTLLTREKSDKLVEAGLDAVNFSLDAACGETYGMIRNHVRFEDTLRNIEDLNRCKERAGSEKPIVNFSFILIRSNLAEVPDYIRLAHALRGTTVHLMHLVPYENLDVGEESLLSEKKRCNAVLAEARQVARELDINLLEPGDFDLDGGNKEKPSLPLKEGRAFNWFDLNLTDLDEARGCCPFPWHFLAIAPQGNVQPCGWWYKDRFKADFEKNTFEEIWHGSEFSALRERLIKGDLHENCRNCPAVGMGNLHDPRSFSTHSPF